MGAAPRLNIDDQEALFILVGGDGHTDAHVGILGLLLVVSVFLGAEVVAPAISQGAYHGGGCCVFRLFHIGFTDEAVFNQIFHLVQFGNPGGFSGAEEQGHRTGNQCSGSIG